jgi:hypothetical protein
LGLAGQGYAGDADFSLIGSVETGVEAMKVQFQILYKASRHLAPAETLCQTNYKQGHQKSSRYSLSHCHEPAKSIRGRKQIAIAKRCKRYRAKIQTLQK